MIQLDRLRSHLRLLFPENGLNDHCTNGLQLEGKREIVRIATAVSADLATIQAAVEADIDALIVHHGLFWHKDSHVIEGVKKQKISLLLQHGISLFGYHLPLDLHPTIGNNWKAACDLGWTDLEPFGFYNGFALGVKGCLVSTSRAALKTALENYYGNHAVIAPGGKEIIETIGLISGGAHRSIIEAAREGLDAFVTGSFDEPVWSQAYEEKINFFALGHTATEKVGPKALAKQLAKDLKCSAHFIETKNPF